MSGVTIEITTSCKDVKVINRGKLFNVEFGKIGLPTMTLLELGNLRDAIEAMQLEMAKISLKELGGSSDKDWTK